MPPIVRHHGIQVYGVIDANLPIYPTEISTIGLVGTAAEGPESALIRNRTEAVELFGERDGAHTIPDALDAIWDQKIGPQVAVCRVDIADGATPAEMKSAIIGGVDGATGDRTGVHALVSCSSELKVTPRILIVPGWAHDVDVITEMLPIAEASKAHIIADGPGTTDADAIAFRENFGSRRVYVVDSMVRVWDPVINNHVIQPASPRVAGLIAKTDQTHGFWHSISNKELYGISGTNRPIGYNPQDPSSQATFLNNNEVTVIVQDDGWRVWGNRTCSADPRNPFLPWSRTADFIDESIAQAIKRLIDEPINQGFINSVIESVQAYLDWLRRNGAILGGECWADQGLNTKESLMQGRLYINFNVTFPPPAEHIILQRAITDKHFGNLEFTRQVNL